MNISIDLLALVVSLLALGLSLIQFLRDESRTKKESTLNAYNTLQDSALNDLNIIFKEQKRSEDRKWQLDITPEHKDWEKVTDCLAKIEHFAVGVNSGIYSIEIVHRASDKYLVKLYDELSKVIEIKRAENRTGGKHYEEFAKLAKTLEKMNY